MARPIKQLRAIFAALRRTKSSSKWYSKVARGIQQKKYAGESPGQATVHHIMGKFKRGQLHDRAGKVIKNRAQAIAIALSTRKRFGWSS